MTKNEFLNADGSAVNLQGTPILSADEKRAELYKTMSPIKNELINEDGTTSKFNVGELTSSLTAIKTSTQNVLVNEKTLITWDRVVLNDSDNKVFEINTENNSLRFKRDLKRVEILLQLTSNTPSDLANFTWYTQLNHIRVDDEPYEKEFGQKATNYFQSNFILHNVKVGDELYFEMICNKSVSLLFDSKFTYVDFIAVW